MRENKAFSISAAGLHIMAMAFMLCDHIWGVFLVGHDWLTCLGRLSFPMFAFMIVEGYHHTSDLRRYLRRLLVAALLSELPFNLMNGGLFYPVHQNVLWTFLIGLLCICLIERAKATGKRWLVVLTWAAAATLGFLLGFLAMVDYYGAGVLTVLMFYLFRGRKWWHLVGQLAGLYWINTQLLGGFGYVLTLFGQEIFVSRQLFALLALIPLWLYRGEQGYHSKKFQTFCYAFYPAHMLILALIRMIFF